MTFFKACILFAISMTTVWGATGELILRGSPVFGVLTTSYIYDYKVELDDTVDLSALLEQLQQGTCGIPSIQHFGQEFARQLVMKHSASNVTMAQIKKVTLTHNNQILYTGKRTRCFVRK